MLILPNGISLAQCPVDCNGTNGALGVPGATGTDATTPGGAGGTGGTGTSGTNGTSGTDTTLNIDADPGANTTLNSNGGAGVSSAGTAGTGGGTGGTGGTGSSVLGNGSGGTITITLNDGAEVTGTIDGGGGTANSSLVFAMNGSQADFDAVAAVLGSATGGNVTVGGKVFMWTNFDQLINNIAVLVAANPGADIAVNVTSGSIMYPQEICTGKVKVFRLADGSLEVYSGFDVEPPNGFLVGTFTPAEQTSGATHTEPVHGWSTTIANGVIAVRDAAGNIFDTSCRY